MESIGIDVHTVNSKICIVGENAEVLEENGESKQIESDLPRCWESGQRGEC